MLGPDFEELVQEAKTGSAAALGAIYRELYPPVLSYLRAREPVEAEDLASEVFLDVAEGLERFSGDESGFRGWVFTIARRRAIDLARKRSRRSTDLVAHESLEAEPDRADTAADAAAAAELEAAVALIRRLPDRQADVVLLRVIAGLSATETALALRTRPGTVRVLQHRALRHLAKLLDEEARSRPVDPEAV